MRKGEQEENEEEEYYASGVEKPTYVAHLQNVQPVVNAPLDAEFRPEKVDVISYDANVRCSVGRIQNVNIQMSLKRPWKIHVCTFVNETDSLHKCIRFFNNNILLLYYW